MEDVILQPQFRFDSPYLADYFGLWAVHADTFRALVERCQGINLHAHVSSPDVLQDVASRDQRTFTVTDDGVALLRIDGPTMKAVPSMASGTSTVRLRQQLRAARRDEHVRGAMLVMDTPGGTVKGNEDLAADVAAFAAAKPIYAFVEDLCCSAGVSVASQATKRFANIATACYGSMGTYGVILDCAGMAEQLGIKVHVIRAGEFKGMGEPGAPVAEQQLAELQRLINSQNDAYLGLIAKGLRRSIDSLRPLADGRVHLAGDAVKMGLLDGVQSYEATYRQLLAAIGSHGKTKPGASASAEPFPGSVGRIAATLAELRATFPSSTAAWRETQLEAGASLPEAAIAFAQHVEALSAEKDAAHQKAIEEAVAKAKMESGVSSLGHAPLLAGDEGDGYPGDPIADFDAAVRAWLPIEGAPTLQQRQAAIAHVARTQPGLHLAMLAASNPDKQRARILAEKYDAAAARSFGE